MNFGLGPENYVPSSAHTRPSQETSLPTEQFLRHSLQAFTSRRPLTAGRWAWEGQCRRGCWELSSALKKPQKQGSWGRGQRAKAGRFEGGRRAPAKFPTLPPRPFHRFHQQREFFCGKALANCFLKKAIPERSTPYVFGSPHCEQVRQML